MAESVVLVNGLPGSGKTSLARPLADRLGGPLVSKDALKEALAAPLSAAADPAALGVLASALLWDLAATVADIIVLDSWWFRPRDLGWVEAGLRRSAADRVVEVWCEVPPSLARARYDARTRSAIHALGARTDEEWRLWSAKPRPLGVGGTVRANTSLPVDADALATRVRGVLKSRNLTPTNGPGVAGRDSNAKALTPSLRA